MILLQFVLLLMSPFYQHQRAHKVRFTYALLPSPLLQNSLILKYEYTCLSDRLHLNHNCLKKMDILQLFTESIKTCSVYKSDGKLLLCTLKFTSSLCGSLYCNCTRESISFNKTYHSVSIICRTYFFPNLLKRKHRIFSYT